MKTIILILSAFALPFIFTSTSSCQGESAVPFLLITSSPEGNGMGGISSSVVSDNAIAPISNPAQAHVVLLVAKW